MKAEPTPTLRGARPTAEGWRHAAGSCPRATHRQQLAPSGHVNVYWPTYFVGETSHCSAKGHGRSEGFQSVHGHQKAADADASGVNQRIGIGSPVEAIHVSAVANRGIEDGRGPVRWVPVVAMTLFSPLSPPVVDTTRARKECAAMTGAGSTGPISTPSAAPHLSDCACPFLMVVSSAARTRVAAAAAETMASRVAALALHTTARHAPRANGTVSKETSEHTAYRATTEFVGGLCRLGRERREGPSAADGSLLSICAASLAAGIKLRQAKQRTGSAALTVSRGPASVAE